VSISQAVGEHLLDYEFKSVRNLTATAERLVNVCVVAAALAGTMLRCVRGATVGLNPDEALHLLACHQETFAGALREIAKFHHPPLYLVLTAMLGPLLNYELGARLIAVLAGSLLPVVLFGWLRPRLGLAAASTALVATALSPNLITLSTQVRSYTLAFLLTAAALWWLDDGVDRRRVGSLWLAGLALLGAILTDFTVALVCPAITLYGVSRLTEKWAPRPFWIAWGASVAVAGVAFGLLYWLQIRHLSIDAKGLSDLYLQGGFPREGRSIVVFSALAVLKQFAYLASSVGGGVVWLVVFVMGVAAGTRSQRLLLVTPLVTGVAMALLGLMPFARTRHSAMVSVCIAVGLALAARRWFRTRPGAWLVTAAVVMTVMVTVAEKEVLDIPDAQLDRAVLRAVPAYLHSLTDGTAPVLASEEARLMIECYRIMQGLPALRVESDEVTPKSPEAFATLAARFRERHKIAATEGMYFVEGGFFPVAPGSPYRAELVRSFAMLRVWRVAGGNAAATAQWDGAKASSTLPAMPPSTP
jgi:hypothetical protein